MKAAAALLALLLLAGCDKDDLRPDDKSAICKALVGPIKYNTTDPKSKRHAGVVLGLDLKERNQIGRGLNCPQYR